MMKITIAIGVFGLVTLSAAEPLMEGALVPDVQLRQANGEVVDLRTLTAEQPTVLVFYRGGWCPYCTRHLAALAEVEEALEELGYRVLAISPDRPENIAAAMAEAVFHYQLLSDSSMAASQAFGLAFQVDKATLDTYEGFGIDLVEASGEKHHLLPVPAVYIVDTEHRIRFAHVDPDYRHRLDPEALLNAARKAGR